MTSVVSKWSRSPWDVGIWCPEEELDHTDCLCPLFQPIVLKHCTFSKEWKVRKASGWDRDVVRGYLRPQKGVSNSYVSRKHVVEPINYHKVKKDERQLNIDVARSRREMRDWILNLTFSVGSTLLMCFRLNFVLHNSHVEILTQNRIGLEMESLQS